MNFNEWLKYGVDHGFCSEQSCQTHAGIPMTQKEEEAWDEGLDPCAHVVRLGTPEDWDNDI